MTDFFGLCLSIASQLDGTIRPAGDNADDAPSGNDIVWIDLANEREGLRVVVRSKYENGSVRLRATMSQTMASRNGASYQETPRLYELETAAAPSRGADVIARQIESKIVQPAIPMLEAWRAKQAESARLQLGVEAAAARYQAAFPTARITIRKGEAEFYLSRHDGGYMQAEINESGGLYIRRVSRIPESAAMTLVASLMPETIS